MDGRQPGRTFGRGPWDYRDDPLQSLDDLCAPSGTTRRRPVGPSGRSFGGRGSLESRWTPDRTPSPTDREESNQVSGFFDLVGGKYRWESGESESLAGISTTDLSPLSPGERNVPNGE